MSTEKFCGRKNILELLKRRVLDLKEGYRQNLALLGYPYVGKTAILHKFLSEIDTKDAITVYLDLANQDFAYFYHKVVASLLYEFSRSRQLPLHDDIPLLLESTREHLPQTAKAVKKIQSLLSQHKRSDAYREIISLPQVFAQEADAFCVLIFDEFQELENLGVTDVFKILGSKIMTQKRCLYVVASSLPAVAEGILSEKMSLLFGNFEKVLVEPFDLKTSQEFISAHLPGVKMSDSLRYFLVDFSGGQALPLQLICEQILSLAVVHRQQEVFLPLLTQAMENVLFNPWGVLGRHFDLLLQQLNPARNSFSVLSILLSLAQGRKKMKELAAECGLKQTTVQQRMSRLLEQGVVSKNGSLYFLKDKVFRYWLKYVFLHRKKALELDPVRFKESFRQDMQQSYDLFLANSQKDLSSRIVDLLSCFEKEAFHINGRRYDLPSFEEINPARVEGAAGDAVDIIRAATKEGEWLVALKAGLVGESDINMILSEAKKAGPKPQRCILISLRDLDENARVRALQERIWVWNEGELSALLNLFDKPYIIPA